MGNRMFVSEERQREVTRLVDSFHRVSRTGVPALIVYVAPPGWGKTRIVQEFYRVLASTQNRPAYWPPSLVPRILDGQPEVLRLGYERKAVAIHDVTVPDGAAIPWLWLAPSTGRLGDGSPAPVLDAIIQQLTSHLTAVLRAVGPQGRTPPAIAAMADVLSPSQIMDLADEVADVRGLIWDAWRAHGEVSAAGPPQPGQERPPRGCPGTHAVGVDPARRRRHCTSAGARARRRPRSGRHSHRVRSRSALVGCTCAHHRYQLA